MALLTAGAVWWLWGRLSLPKLGHEEIWFALGWLAILAWPVRAQTRALPQDDHVIPPLLFDLGPWGLAGLFLALLLCAPQLGNYKLWLGLTYLCGLTLRLAGLILWRSSGLTAPAWPGLGWLLRTGGVAGLGCLLLVPWVRPELCAAWPPPLGGLARPLATCLLWAGVAGAAPLALRLWGGSQRGAWLLFLALGLGPLPALSLALTPLLPLGLALLGLALLCGLRLAHPRPLGLQEEPRPLPLYWLLRALLLLWWGVGIALTLEAAWWQPRMADLLEQSLWLRAVGLGAFLVACLGLLAEYSLPLITRAEILSPGRQRKVLGIVMSALALLASLAPLLLVRAPQPLAPPAQLLERPRAELLSAPVSLSPDNPELELTPPNWLTGVQRLFVVSLLTNGVQVPQGEAVAQLVATDDQDIPHFFNLRAGVDTAEWALDKREVAAQAQHGSARLAQSWLVYSPTGEAFSARTYFSGLYLGGDIYRLREVRLRYLYRNPPGRPPLTLEVKRIFIN